MALAKGTNSYATVEEADSYFTDTLSGEAWVDLDDSIKAQALITATRLLDEQQWVGYISSTSQDLAWPRIGEYFDPKLGIPIVLDPVEIPSRVTNALFELALHLVNNEGILSDTGSVLNIEVGQIKLTQIQSASQIPMNVSRHFKPLLANGGSRTWWRAN